jgi:hypothetical protein
MFVRASVGEGKEAHISLGCAAQHGTICSQLLVLLLVDRVVNGTMRIDKKFSEADDRTSVAHKKKK